MKRTGWHLAASAGFSALLCGASPAFAQTAPSLGAAQSFAVLGASTVTNTGPSRITGDLGVSPGTAVTGFPPGLVVSGTIHAADAAALAAKNSVTTAYNSLASQACTQDLTGQDLGGKTLTAGVYCFSSSAQLTGTLTLNAQGNANAVFIFRIGSTLTTASGSSVVLINAGSLCNIFWQVGSSATLGTATSFIGNIVALASITVTTGATLTGRALALNGAITLDSDAITATCALPPVCPTITLAPATLPNARIGVAYSQTITGSGGAAPYTFTVISGALPPGLTLTPAGLLAGTPTAAAVTSSFTIRGADANGCFATIVYTIVVMAGPACPTITLSPATLPNVRIGVAYSQTITATGGTAPYTFAVISGVLPAGLTLTSAGLLAGTPTDAAVTSSFTIRGTDANGCFATIAYTLVLAAPPPICPPIALAPAMLPAARIGVAYSQTITGSGGTAPYTFTVVGGALPTGLTLTPAGLLSGTPTAAGGVPFSFTIRGTDANGCSATIAYTIAVAAAPSVPAICPVITLAPTTPPSPTVGVAYSQTFVASGGTAPYSFGVTAGALPAGMTLTAAGVLSGTPTTDGTSNFTIRATDANGCFVELAITMSVVTAVPTLPQAFVVLLALGLTGIGYFRLRRRRAQAE